MAHLQEITGDAACKFLQNFRLIDPSGCATVQTETTGAQCFCLSLPGGQVVYCLRMLAGLAWVTVAASNCRGQVTGQVLPLIERQALQMGAAALGFQTARRGLIRRATAAGYRCWPLMQGDKQTGARLEKALHDDA